MVCKQLCKACFESFYHCYQQAHQFFDQDDLIQEDRRQIIKDWMRHNFQSQLTEQQKRSLNQIRTHLKELADTLSLPSSCLANKRDMESFVSFPNPHHKLLTGWREGLLTGYLTPFLNRVQNTEQKELTINQSQ